LAQVGQALRHRSQLSTGVYANADLTLKQAAFDRLTPPTTTAGRYHPPDAVMAFLDDL
jgi:integrase/recombinase XerD